MKIHIWDTAGSDRFKSMGTLYYRDAHAAMIVYSVDNAESITQVDPWLEQLENNCNNPKVIKFLVGNKSDIEKGQRKVSLKEGKEVADAHKMDFFEVSALFTKGDITGMFTEIIEKIRKNYNEKELSGGSAFIE